MIPEASSHPMPLRSWLTDRRLLHVNAEEVSVVAGLQGLMESCSQETKPTLVTELRRSGTELTVLVEAVSPGAAFATPTNRLLCQELTFCFL